MLRIPVANMVACGLVEWALFFLLWLLFEDQTNLYELLFGAGAALLAAIGTELIRRQPFARFRPRVFWIGPPAFGTEASAYISKTIKVTLEHWKGAVFVDSTAFNESKPLPLRKPHFGDDDARKWARFAFSRIEPELKAPPRQADGPP